MRILITGAGGQVGTALAQRAPARGHDVIALNHGALDICDKQAVEAALALHHPDLVINAAAYTAVDRAEEEAERAFTINADGAEHLARGCASADIPFLHISTDFVFDGEKPDPYVEEDPVAPLNVYGKSKVEGEARIIAVGHKYLILRTAWVFGGAQSFVATMLHLAKSHKELNIIDDQIGGPTASGDIAGSLLLMAEAALEVDFSDWGIYHYCGAPAVTWYGFAKAIFAGKETPVLHPIPTEGYPLPARRPKNSRLDCSKIKRVFGIDQPDWQQALSEHLNAQEQKAGNANGPSGLSIFS
ncbi:MAG: dTDP-4-dehydrorhamnose reductase [Sneathiella sp.]|nr:dTDP-4-dehydrorhamnose reductase [Sneathiella sp.]